MERSKQDSRSRDVSRARTILVVLSLLGSAVAAWLYWGVTPSVVQVVGNLNDRSAQSQAMTDALIAERIAVGIANSDYGEVQEALVRFEHAGVFSRAVVVNASNKIVAEIGGLDGLRIGDVAPGEMFGGSRRIPISVESRKLGELLLPAMPETTLDSISKAIVGLRSGAFLFAAIALLLAVALPWQWRKIREDVETKDATANAKSARDLSVASDMLIVEAPDASASLRAEASSVPPLKADASLRNSAFVADDLDDDDLARMVYADDLTKRGQQVEAVKQLEIVERAGFVNPNLHYRMGLAYFDAGHFEKSLECAHFAYGNGVALVGLKNKLVAAGKWREPPVGAGSDSSFATL